MYLIRANIILFIQIQISLTQQEIPQTYILWQTKNNLRVIGTH